MNVDASNTEKPKEKGLFWIPNSLRFVCEAVEKGCSASGPYSVNSELLLLMKTLSYIERSCIANYFCKLPWNLGSVKVLGILNQLRILTAAEYILSQTDDEHVQLVLNDLLETEFDLMANLVITGHYDLMVGSKISEYVAESIRRLLDDLVNDPKLNNFDYMHALNHSVPKEIYYKFLTSHLKIIVSMNKRSTKVAFASFSDWMKHNFDDYVLVSNFYQKAVAGNDLEVLKTLLIISTGENFVGWKNYLILLGLIAKHSSTECFSYIKKFIKDRLKLVAETGSKEIMAHLLLSIRTVLMFHDDKTETYDKWYKLHIGDMKFVFNATEFKAVISVLTDLVPYEVDEEYLEVHVKTSISPPVMCSQLCRDYKLLCRTRISDAADCSILLDNDDDLFTEAFAEISWEKSKAN
ncbi:uncharacterized protein LOC129911628 [Episyrphus balteatus]|uniref:uncharacterized protein LOC129911628 n=1 Tax=Episyrphus balteatus TaxID=286459 RepID=UPI002485786F|nr:uncharacterized protein LOC129911628 [Episyrphus balteatus]